jgi:hypothetical protein
MIRELRTMIEFYADDVARRLPALRAPQFCARIEDLARSELVLQTHRCQQPLPLNASRIGGRMHWPAAWRDDPAFDARRTTMLAMVALAQLPPTPHLPRRGVLLVYAPHGLDSSGQPRDVAARYFAESLTTANSITASDAAAAAAGLELRALSATLTLSLPPPDAPAVPRDIDAPAYAFVQQRWLEARAARGQHALLGHAASAWNVDRLATLQAQCDCATLTRRAGHRCGRDLRGLCGRRPLLTLKSCAPLSFANGGLFTVCGVMLFVGVS